MNRFIFYSLVAIQLVCGQYPPTAQEETSHLPPNHQSAFPCYNEQNQPQRCVPEFVNAAFNRRVHATNTCGEHKPIQFCVQSGLVSMIQDCDTCNAKSSDRAHPPSYLTDFNNRDNETWWQSDTMYEGLQYPNMVNLTLDLGKAFDITYVRLKFHSPRPESFAIYKMTKGNDAWIPWQYYSASCRSTYSLHDKAPILPGGETVAQCTSDYSDISPLTGANIAFSTLEGRPSASDFENSPVLQEWVAATAIRVVLNRMNTYGDELFGDEKVQQSYFYAISDFAVGGRCKCNGHANECVKSTGVGLERLVCRCEHNTMGEDCEMCLPFYNDRPWKPATAEDANECKVCNCNGMSNRCFFDEEMYDDTGSGGHCVECAGNTHGNHCQNCLPNYWRRHGDQVCTACNCNEIGSLTQQCNEQGNCICRPGVTGQFCDRCLPGFFEFASHGCKDCECSVAGSVNNQPQCRADNGICACKLNVEGPKCDKCKPGYFHLDESNEFGCSPCFCHGHSSVCESAQDYYMINRTSDFTEGPENWKIEGPSMRAIDVQYNDRDKNIVATEFGNVTYFLAPDIFLNNQRLSYNQILSFKLRVVDRNSRASIKDVILQGANGQSISLPIFAQNNSLPDIYEQTYRYRLHENPKFQWTPRSSSMDFMSILSNLTAIKIRATFSPGDAGFLDDFSMGSASKTPPEKLVALSKGTGNGKNGNRNGKAMWVESCVCPEGFVGQNCESCGPRYRREPKFGGPFARCIKCECHNHSDFCQAESGRCMCEHNTAGETCERCDRGYYGNALRGTPDDCKPCPCPNQGPCILHTDNEVICLECATGYAGRFCDICADGYYGDPTNKVDCKLCECSGNIDPNSIGNCDRLTGECKKCVHNTDGFHCEKCAPGFYGDALLEPKGDCKRCDCYAPGTFKPQSNYKVLECIQKDGQCQCLPHVTGRACDICEVGYYNITSGVGCQSCHCDPLGSTSKECDQRSGQCQCKPGVVGARCDQCQAFHFGFNAKGCEACNCLPIGSLTAECDIFTGQCKCRSTVQGRRCDQCMENKYNLQAGCLDCDPCYSLVQKRVNDFRLNVTKMKDMMKDILENPTQVNDTDFDSQLRQVAKSVDLLAEVVTSQLALENTETGGQTDDLRKVLSDAENNLKSVTDTLQGTTHTADEADQALQQWETIKGQLQTRLKQAKEFLENEGSQAWNQAKAASDTYGQQSSQMTAIAEEARELAAKRKLDAKRIEEYANKAVNLSIQCEKIASDVVYGGQTTSHEISRLKTAFMATEKLFNDTEQLGKEQLERAAKLYQESASILAKVDALKLPTLDTEKFMKDAVVLSDTANDIKKRAQESSTENRPILDDAKRLLDDVDRTAKSALASQQILDKWLAEIEALKDRALKAVDSSAKIKLDAEETLNSLRGFDASVEQTKGDAIKAMDTVPSLQSALIHVENLTRNAQNAMGEAKIDAENAMRIAQEAEEISEAALKDAKHVKLDASNLKEGAQNAKAEALKVYKETTAKLESLNNYKANSEQDKSKVHSVLTEASSANNIASKVNETTLETTETLKAILREIGNRPDSLNETESERLENLLNDYDQQLKVIDEKLSVSKSNEKETKNRLEFLLTENNRLAIDVENIRQIRDSLPADQCFNVVPIEGNR